MALSILTALGLILLKLSLNALSPRQWTLQQAITDAHMSYEGAWAERIPFETLSGSGSPWPQYPSQSSSQVEMGKLPGGRAITATVIRTRMADSNNLPAFGGTGTSTTNPSGMVVWKVMSIARYQVGGRTYVKSRTVIRFQ